jgi:hypothetical protein
MLPPRFHLLLAFIALIQIFGFPGFGCSMCKVTINGKTYLGNNEDSWRTGSRISFVNAPAGKLGALYMSYGDMFPQGGMNEAGLAFDGLTIYKKNIKIDPSKRNVTNFSEFVSDIMQNCKTVEDVKTYAYRYNRHIIPNGELFFADKSGRYLIMEPDTMLLGNDGKYIIANFCPSITPESDRLDWARYRRGRDFIARHQSGNGADYCLALVDTMHECREKLGDGTMYSSVANLSEGDFSLYFYHDYTKEVKFNLKQELAKGDRVIELASLFPDNIEYDWLVSYKVPQNDRRIFFFLLFCGAIFGVSAIFFLLSYLINVFREGRTPDPHIKLRLVMIMICVPMLYYMIALIRTPAMFYSKAPFQDFQFSLKNIAAYLPFVPLLLIVPLIRVNLYLLRRKVWGLSSKLIFTLNNLVYITLILMFTYWGFYDVL